MVNIKLWDGGGGVMGCKVEQRFFSPLWIGKIRKKNTPTNSALRRVCFNHVIENTRLLFFTLCSIFEEKKMCTSYIEFLTLNKC